jgi:hypothetical protein
VAGCAGCRNGLEAVTKQMAGYITADAHGTKVLVSAWLQKSGIFADSLERLRPIQEDGHSPPESRVSRLEFAVSAVCREKESGAAELADSAC